MEEEEFDIDSLSDDIIDLIDEIDEAADDEDEDLVDELSEDLIDLDEIESICLYKLAEHVMYGEEEMAIGWTNIALKAQLDPFNILLNGLAHGMSLIGAKYEKGEAFVPELMIASSAMYGGMDILAPLLKDDSADASTRHTVIIGTVEGDVHDIGKNLVKTLLSANGFNCVDLGNDVPADEFIKAAKEHNPVAISLSTLMTTTMAEMPKVIELVNNEGLRGKTLIMVGGAPITESYAQSIGADVSPKDATSAAAWLKSKT